MKCEISIAMQRVRICAIEKKVYSKISNARDRNADHQHDQSGGGMFSVSPQNSLTKCNPAMFFVVEEFFATL